MIVSGGGTNLQALLDSEARGENPNGKITLVVASKPGVFALERAAKVALQNSGKFIPWQVITISIDGNILSEL